MNIQPQYARLLADTARKIIHQEDNEAESGLGGCASCGSPNSCTCLNDDYAPSVSFATKAVPASVVHKIQSLSDADYAPIPALGIKDVLESAGYNLKSLAQELDVCAACFEEYDGSSFDFKGMSYCCRACADGDKCTCEPVQASASNYSDAEAAKAQGLKKVNSLWAQTTQPSNENPQDSSTKHNSLWLDESDAQDSFAVHKGYPKTNAYWRP